MQQFSDSDLSFWLDCRCEINVQDSFKKEKI